MGFNLVGSSCGSRSKYLRVLEEVDDVSASLPSFGFESVEGEANQPVVRCVLAQEPR